MVQVMSSSRTFNVSKQHVTRRHFVSGAATAGALTLLNGSAPAFATTISREGKMQPQAQAAAINNIAPIPMECDAPFLKITGELPRELNGTLYRNCLLYTSPSPRD